MFGSKNATPLWGGSEEAPISWAYQTRAAIELLTYTTFLAGTFCERRGWNPSRYIFQAILSPQRVSIGKGVNPKSSEFHCCFCNMLRCIPKPWGCALGLHFVFCSKISFFWVRYMYRAASGEELSEKQWFSTSTFASVTTFCFLLCFWSSPLSIGVFMRLDLRVFAKQVFG